MLGHLDRGWAVASVDFRNSCEDSNAHPNPTQVLDIYTASIWLSQVLIPYLGEHDLDPDRFLLIGSSAGGHLAMLAGMLANNSPWADHLPYIGVSSLYGVYDFVDPWLAETEVDAAGNVVPLWPENYRATAFLMGCPGDFWDSCSEWDKVFASPTSWVDADDPPVLMMHGRNDSFAAWSQADLMWARLANQRGAGTGTGRFRTNGTDTFIELLSTQHLNNETRQCEPNANDELLPADHGCISGDNAQAVNFLVWLSNMHG